MTETSGRRAGRGGSDASPTASDTWASDIDGSVRASRRVAWIIAGISAGVALIEAMALATLAPLKTVVPFTLLVDRQTGYIQTLEGLKPGALSQDGAVTQSFLVQYVIARETFDAADLRDNYKKVMSWSADNARSQYRLDMAHTNPSSPLVVYAPTTIVQTTIKAVTLLTPKTALVRFETTRRDGGAGPGEARPYTAVLSFHYLGSPMRLEDRLTNPLGFQVLSYRRDAESVQSQVSRPLGAGSQ